MSTLHFLLSVASLAIGFFSFAARADIGLVDERYHCSAVYRQGETLYRKACGRYHGQEVNRHCEGEKAEILPFAAVLSRVQDSWAIDRRFRGADSLRVISGVIERYKRQEAENSLSSGEREKLVKALRDLLGEQQKLLRMKATFLDRLAEGNDLLLDVNYNPQKYHQLVSAIAGPREGYRPAPVAQAPAPQPTPQGAIIAGPGAVVVTGSWNGGIIAGANSTVVVGGQGGIVAAPGSVVVIGGNPR